MKITEVTVKTMTPQRIDRMFASFTTDDARYHLWFNPSTLEAEPILYKNSLPLDGRAATRRLDARNKTNGAIMAAMMANVVEQNLVGRALAEAATERARQATAAHADYCVAQQRAFGPRFYQALDALVASARRLDASALTGITDELKVAAAIIAEYGVTTDALASAEDG